MWNKARATKIWKEDKKEVIRIQLYFSNERINTTG
jgi:hypothetical protein